MTEQNVVVLDTPAPSRFRKVAGVAGAATLMGVSNAAHAADTYGGSTAPSLPGIDPASLTGFLAAQVALMTVLITTAFSLRVGEVGWKIFKRMTGRA